MATVAARVHSARPLEPITHGQPHYAIEIVGATNTHLFSITAERPWIRKEVFNLFDLLGADDQLTRRMMDLAEQLCAVVEQGVT